MTPLLLSTPRSQIPQAFEHLFIKCFLSLLFFPGYGINNPRRRSKIGNQALVTGVEKDSPACAAGVKSGWAILKVGPTDISPLLNSISQQYEKKTWKSLMLTFAIKALLIGEIGESLAIRFSDQYDLTVEKKIVLAKPRGKIFRLGYFDFGYVWCEKKMLAGNIGYIAFNGFLDVSRVMPVFNNAVKEFMKARGIIIDIRGNPGGLGFMSTGMAGWFIEKKGLSLGTLITRDNRLKFAILPRPEVYTGRLAILVDRVSASTSEIFAAGLQALGRGRTAFYLCYAAQRRCLSICLRRLPQRQW